MAEIAEELGYREILEKIYKERGFDFSQYKETGLKRRMQRRMRARGVELYRDYIAILDTDPVEYDRLIDVFLINVTEVFRDKEAFDVIKRDVLPDIIRKDSVRIWSAGCSSGEEVYSISMLVDEGLGDKRDNFSISIYGTDIDTDSLLKAGEAGHKNCHFILHDLVLDKPLNDIDLILCRNVLIYFERPLQEKIYMDFYNALNEGGYLFLDKAETLIGPAQERFSVIDKQWRIYKKEE